MNTAKIKRQIFERWISEQERQTYNKQHDTETNINNLQIMQYNTFTDSNGHRSIP